ncbi:MAG: DsrE/DsrF/DrsH-like family protein [Dehalococcoidia bacterium]|jgi:peroxiredoxin family protein|nr:DsrE/DsrF/DrsH-like family protein [Dehalococcoidia bacterium]
MGNKMSLVLSTDHLDKVCAALTITNAAAASGMEVSILFTCWGINVVKRKGARPRGEGFLDRVVTAEMNILYPSGSDRLPLSRFNFLGLGSWLMRRRMKAKGIQSIPEMLADATDLGVRYIACDNPMTIMGLRREDLIDEVEAVVGAASYIKEASDADITLFV